MKKIIIFFILFCVIISPSFAQIESTKDVIRKSAVSIFSVYGHGTSLCSGVVIKNDDNKALVLTAKHCIDVQEEIFVEWLEVNKIIVSVNDDLALLVINQKIPNKTVSKIAKTNIKRGDNIYHLGYPTLEEYYSTGIQHAKTKDCYYAKIKVIHGCSGGGFWNGDGELIGIVWGMSSYGETNLSIFEPISDVYKFLRSI